jgi:hypothetical protein
VLSAGMLLAQCAIWQGDLELWRRAKVHISEAVAKDDRERDGITLAICAVDSMLYDVKNFPAWFKIGCFELLHRDSLPAAKVYYAKYLYALGYAVAMGLVELAESLLKAKDLPETSSASAVGHIPIALSGGTFINRILYREVTEALKVDGYAVYSNEKVPCGDGGIALGQMYLASFVKD